MSIREEGLMSTVKRSDVESVERKLQEFARELPEQEQKVLAWLTTRAHAATAAGVNGNTLDSAPNEQHDLATALGFTEEVADLRIQWELGVEA